MSGPRESSSANTLVRTAVLCALIGLLCVSLFLWWGFNPWSVGFGVFLGAPLLLVAMGLYIVAVFRELRQRGIL